MTYWNATMQLRWKVDDLDHAANCATLTVWGKTVSTTPPGVLEQLWVSNRGDYDWRPVPIVGPDDE